MQFTLKLDREIVPGECQGSSLRPEVCKSFGDSAKQWPKANQQQVNHVPVAKLES